MRHATLLAGLLALGACFGSKGGGGAGTATTAKPAGPDHAATIADPLGYLPIDSEIVLAIDGEQVRKSPLWATVAPKLTSAPELAKFEQQCGVKPLDTMSRARFGLKVRGENDISAVAVVQGLDRARLTACAEKADAGDDSLTVDRGVTLITTPDGTMIAMTFVDASTLVTQVGKGVTRDSLLAVTASGAPLRGSATFTDLLGQVDTGATVWGLANTTGEAFADMRTSGLNASAVFGHLQVGPGVTAKVTLRLDSPQAAQQLASGVQGQLGMAQAFLEKVSVQAAGADVVVDAAMTDEQVSNLAGLAGLN